MIFVWVSYIPGHGSIFLLFRRVVVKVIPNVIVRRVSQPYVRTVLLNKDCFKFVRSEGCHWV